MFLKICPKIDKIKKKLHRRFKDENFNFFC